MESLFALTLAAAGTGILHTILGPDHYLPFIALARARNWTVRRSVVFVVLCGLAHAFTAILLGVAGLWLGRSIGDVFYIDESRATIAAWALIFAGTVYALWGLHRARRETSGEAASVSIMGLTLFLVFFFGPCEPLIPFVMYAGGAEGLFAAIFAASAFTLATLATMLVIIMPATFGLARLSSATPLAGVVRYGHALAGVVIALCGVAVEFGGL